ncbi:hypothetical protein DFS33DRAFT_1269856 [Desarmillaria ectypa]|nr:hypothetical protein DFS33DRAFT_1269856 [Desarmillaria ectypa]
MRLPSSKDMLFGQSVNEDIWFTDWVDSSIEIRLRTNDTFRTADTPRMASKRKGKRSSEPKAGPRASTATPPPVRSLKKGERYSFNLHEDISAHMLKCTKDFRVISSRQAVKHCYRDYMTEDPMLSATYELQRADGKDLHGRKDHSGARNTRNPRRGPIGGDSVTDLGLTVVIGQSRVSILCAVGGDAFDRDMSIMFWTLFIKRPSTFDKLSDSHTFDVHTIRQRLDAAKSYVSSQLASNHVYLVH